jgi:hypothetical protein
MEDAPHYILDIVVAKRRNWVLSNNEKIARLSSKTKTHTKKKKKQTKKKNKKKRCTFITNKISSMPLKLMLYIVSSIFLNLLGKKKKKIQEN